MRNILIFCTRSLCYFSGEFFARELAEIFQNKGDRVETVLLPDEPGSTAATRDLSQFEILEKYIGKTYDAVIDFNSFLPYLTDDDGTPILDEIDAPFYNYLLDHPLYHHPGLSYKLRDYNVICIDKKHAAYVRKYYPHIKKILYQPLPGAKCTDKNMPGAKYRGNIQCAIKCIEEISSDTKCDARSISETEFSSNIFFSGTFTPESELLTELLRRPRSIQDAVLEIAEFWNPEKETIEDVVRGYLDSLNTSERDVIFSSIINEESLSKTAAPEEENLFPLLLNHMYSLDRIMRYRMRKKVITALAEAGIELDIQGEGWEKCLISFNGEVPDSQKGKEISVLSLPNVHLIPSAPMDESIKEIAYHKYILDINPLFFEGLHDRVSTALVNGCTVYSNMNPDTVPEEYEKQFHHYSSYEIGELIHWLKV